MSVHTYTHSREERRAQQRPTFSLLPQAAKIAAEGDLIARVLGEGSKKGRKDGENILRFGEGCLVRGLQSKEKR